MRMGSYPLCVRSGFVELVSRLSMLGRLNAFRSVAPAIEDSVATQHDPYCEEGAEVAIDRVETMFRLLDLSGGKQKLIQSNRRSVSVRQFNLISQ